MTKLSITEYKNQLPDHIELMEPFDGRRKLQHVCLTCGETFKITAKKMLINNCCPNNNNHPVDDVIEIPIDVPIEPVVEKVVKPQLTVAKYINSLPCRKKILENITDVNKPVKHKCSWCKYISWEVPHQMFDQSFVCKKCGKI